MGRGGGEAKTPVISADHDTPLGIRNQRTEGMLLEMEWENRQGSRGNLGVGGCVARARHATLTLCKMTQRCQLASRLKNPSSNGDRYQEDKLLKVQFQPAGGQ